MRGKLRVGMAGARAPSFPARYRPGYSLAGSPGGRDDAVAAGSVAAVVVSPAPVGSGQWAREDGMAARRPLPVQELALSGNAQGHCCSLQLHACSEFIKA
jgi:hypothetical protein